MARNNVRLINYHTTGTTGPNKADMRPGEIAVGKDLIWAMHNDNEELSAFIASGTIVNAINVAKESIEGNVNSVSVSLTKLSGSVVNDYATVESLNAVSGASSAYTDSQINAIKGSGYTGGTLESLSDAITALKGDGNTTVGAVASRVTKIESVLGASDNEGLRKDVADLKTTVGDSTTGLVKSVADLNSKDSALDKKINAVSGASSAYTDSQIIAIKGADYEEGTTLASLKSNIGTEQSRIDKILKDAPTDLTSFKDVDTKITNTISSAYKYQGSVESKSDLPDSGKTTGYVYNVVKAVGTPGDENYTPAGTNYAWNGTDWDALGGTVDLSAYATKEYVSGKLSDVTGEGTSSLKTRLGQAETNISNLQESATTFEKNITTIQGWKINGASITADTVLHGHNLYTDTGKTQTLNEAIAAAKQAGTDAQTYAKGVSGSVKTLSEQVSSNKTTIDTYTVNGIQISKNPTLTGENVLVGTGTTEDDKKITLNAAIAAAKQAGTDAQAYAEGVSGSVESLSATVGTHATNINDIKSDLSKVSGTTVTAVQTISVTNSETNNITAKKNGTTVTFNFDNMVIDCGEF